MTAGSAARSKQQNDTWIVKWLTLLSVHFKAQLSESEIKIYCDELRQMNRTHVEAAFSKCLHECEFMPKIKEIRARMPEPEQYGSGTSATFEFKPVRDWYEPFGSSVLHIWADEKGRKQVKVEPRPSA